MPFEIYAKIDNNLGWIIYIIQGSVTTLKYSIISVVLGLLLGSIIAFLNYYSEGLPRFFIRFYLSLIRGTPLLLQLIICYFLLPKLLGIKLSIFVASLLALSINSSAYIAEIIRSGINSIDSGQFEAAKALSIPKHLMMKDIILPQALRNILPALVNEVINMVKESAIIGIIGETDILRRAQLVAAEKYDYLAPLLVAAAIYYILVTILTFIAKFIEKRINYTTKSQ